MTKRDVRQIANIPLPAHDYSGAVERLFADMTDEDWLIHAEIHRAMVEGFERWECDFLWAADICDSCAARYGADPISGRWARSSLLTCYERCDGGCREETAFVVGLDGVYGGHRRDFVAPDHLSFEAIEQDHPFTIGVDW